MGLSFLQLFKGLLSRLLFFAHGIISVYLLWLNSKKDSHWALVLPLILLIGETILVLFIRKGQEYKYFWPSGFLYIMTIIPIVWITEMDLLNGRIDQKNAQNTAGTNATQQAKELEDAKVLAAAFQLSNEVVGKKVCELGLIIGLIAGRWLMPRGTITRDQLSALLLGYVGNAADIIELFETFEEPGVIYERSVTIAVIAVYTWSIFQFTLVTTATIKDKKMLEDDMEKQSRLKKFSDGSKKNKVQPARRISGTALRGDDEIKRQYIEELRRKKNNKKAEGQSVRGKGRKKASLKKQTSINETQTQLLDEKVRRRALHGEVFQILVTLLMQDGPFLVLRLYLIIMFNIASEMHIFFTCKNAIVSILLVYRLCILTCRGEDIETDWYKEDAEAKLHNVQLAVLSAQFMESGKLTVK